MYLSFNYGNFVFATRGCIDCFLLNLIVEMIFFG